MRRLYILLGAALIAATVVALFGAGGAGAQTKAKKYSALAYSESTVSTTVGNAKTKNGALNKALQHCESVASGYPSLYNGDCQSANWVKNGWLSIARESSLEGPPYSPTFGWGAGVTREEAKSNADYSCRQGAGEPCVFELTDRTKYFNSGEPTYAGNF
jgi:hypothetical protein